MSNKQQVNDHVMAAAVTAVRETMSAKDAEAIGAGAMVAALAIALRTDYQFRAKVKGDDAPFTFTLSDYVAALASDNRKRSASMTDGLLDAFGVQLGDEHARKVGRALLSRNLLTARYVAASHQHIGLDVVSIHSHTGAMRRVQTLALPIASLCDQPGDDAPAWMLKAWLESQNTADCVAVLPRNGIALKREGKGANGKPVVYGFPHNMATLKEKAEAWVSANIAGKRRAPRAAKGGVTDWQSVAAAVETLGKPVREGSALLSNEQERAISLTIVRLNALLDANRRAKEAQAPASNG